MNGQTMSYDKYNEYIKTMPAPVMPSQLPKLKINFSAIAQYAKEHGICIASLTQQEKAEIIKTIGTR